MRAVLVDTGPLYALVDPDDRHHQRALGEVGRLGKEGLAVALAYPTLLEAHTLVMRRLGLAEARRWMSQALRGCGLLNPTAEDYLEASGQLGELPDQAITLFDSLLAVLSRRLGVAVWTYDHHFDLLRANVWR